MIRSRLGSSLVTHSPAREGDFVFPRDCALCAAVSVACALAAASTAALLARARAMSSAWTAPLDCADLLSRLFEAYAHLRRYSSAGTSVAGLMRRRSRCGWTDTRRFGAVRSRGGRSSAYLIDHGRRQDARRALAAKHQRPPPSLPGLSQDRRRPHLARLPHPHRHLPRLAPRQRRAGAQAHAGLVPLRPPVRDARHGARLGGHGVRVVVHGRRPAQVGRRLRPCADARRQEARPHQLLARALASADARLPVPPPGQRRCAC